MVFSMDFNGHLFYPAAPHLMSSLATKKQSTEKEHDEENYHED